MKIQISKELANKLISEGKVQVKAHDPWWVIALKVLAYLVGLLLAGASTPATVRTIVDMSGVIF